MEHQSKFSRAVPGFGNVARHHIENMKAEQELQAELRLRPASRPIPGNGKTKVVRHAN